jgi:hypothetical protein
MSNYDRLAISDKPDFYFSSNSSSDQSGAGLYGITNSSTNVGQPILVGNPSSWKITDSETLELDANPIFFRNGASMEFVVQKMQPLDTVCIFGDADEYNGIFLMPDRVQVRFVDADMVQRSVDVIFSAWPEKMHIVLTFDVLYCTLTVNNQSAQVTYRETDPDSISTVEFRSSSGNTYYIDGIGVYSKRFQSKINYINADAFDYLNFINKTYLATGTRFDGHRSQEATQILNSQFTPDPNQPETFIYTMTFPLSTDEDFSSISIESNFLDMEMQYSTNDVAWTDFTGNVSFTPSTDFFVLQIRVKAIDAARSFIINVFSSYDDRITTQTPAELVPNGGPFYPNQYSTSIVNFPEGVELYEISYEGEWIEYVPNSIEILFMPKSTSKTIVFESADGSVSCGTGGSITGYTAYLNGSSVANLNDARVNQWNHLVLTKVSVSADTFYLNSDSSRAGENVVEYALLASYPTVLTSGTVSDLYSILSSYHNASISDNPSGITEGELDGTSPFKVYTYAWAIIGGGGV